MAGLRALNSFPGHKLRLNPCRQIGTQVRHWEPPATGGTSATGISGNVGTFDAALIYWGGSLGYNYTSFQVTATANYLNGSTTLHFRIYPASRAF